jgi:hypothetical protein
MELEHLADSQQRRDGDGARQWAENGIFSASGGPNSDLLIVYFNPGNEGIAASMMSPGSASPEFSRIVSMLGFKNVLGIKLRPDEAPSATFSQDQIVYTGTAQNDGIKWQSAAPAVADDGPDPAAPLGQVVVTSVFHSAVGDDPIVAALGHDRETYLRLQCASAHPVKGEPMPISPNIKAGSYYGRFSTNSFYGWEEYVFFGRMAWALSDRGMLAGLAKLEPGLYPEGTKPGLRRKGATHTPASCRVFRISREELQRLDALCKQAPVNCLGW